MKPSTSSYEIHKTNRNKQTIKNGWIETLTLSCTVSQNGQAHFKNLAAFAATFLNCVWPFWD